MLMTRPMTKRAAPSTPPAPAKRLRRTATEAVPNAGTGTPTAEGGAAAAAESAAISAQESFVLEEEMARARWDLFMSNFIYAFADIREACVLGFSKIPYDLLALENDAMTTSQILSGAPHVLDPFAEGSTAGFTLEDLSFGMLRIVSKFGLGDGERYLLGEDAAHAAEVAHVAERKSSDFIADQELVLRSVDLTTKHLFAEDASEASDRSRGILGRDYGFHNIQRFFDHVYEGAKTDGNFRAVLDMLQGTADYRKTGHGEEMTASAAPFLQVLRSTVKAQRPSFENELFAKRHKIVWTNDTHNNAELVYTIVAHKHSKKITLVFRGSVDLKDWKENFDLGTSFPPNPIEEDYEGKEDALEIRRGFWCLLLRPRVDNGRSKYDEIADKVYEYGRALGENFQLEATGHSLGGVLATLFGFYASADARFNRHHKVRVRTFGSPIPGKVSFARAFRHQEDRGRLLHSRFVMAQDPVPKMRFMNKDYAHTGHRIELSTEADAAPKVTYVEDLNALGTLKNYVEKNGIALFLTNLISLKNLTYNHSVLAYHEALGKKTGGTSVGTKVERRSGGIPSRRHGNMFVPPSA